MDRKIWMTDDLEQMAPAGQDAVCEANVVSELDDVLA
jgi:hypothetical protein